MNKDLSIENNAVIGAVPGWVVALLAYVLAVCVAGAPEIVPACEASFARPENCAPIFQRIMPIVVAGVLLIATVFGAQRALRGHGPTAALFLAATLIFLPLILVWQALS